MKRNIAFILCLMAATPAFSATEHHQEIENHSWSFEGPFGTFDQAQLQRGYQVYKEVCSACHGLKYVSFRNLGDEHGPAFDEAQVKAMAASYDVPNEEGEPGSTRPGKPSDKFPTPAVSGVHPPDLSLMAKARAGFHGPYGSGINQMLYGIGGPEYIYSLLTGYTGKQKEEAGAVLYENKAFPSGWIAMSPPLAADAVSYADGTKATVTQMAEDVTAFLAWTAEPKMTERKQAGVRNIILLVILAGLVWLSNKKLWKKIKHPHE